MAAFFTWWLFVWSSWEYAAHMDEDERCFYYKGFVLMCDPTPVQPSGFRANAVVCSYGTAEVEVFATSPEGVYLISEEAAVEYARGWAVDWVDRKLAG